MIHFPAPIRELPSGLSCQRGDRQAMPFPLLSALTVSTIPMTT
jgi:hypothetical protein